jgi:hypothetical protein
MVGLNVCLVNEGATDESLKGSGTKIRIDNKIEGQISEYYGTKMTTV